MSASTDEHSASAPPAAAVAHRVRVIPNAWALARTHAVFVAILVVGVAVRGLATSAFRPALIFWDSVPFLRNVGIFVPNPERPLGYPAFLRVALAVGNLALVPVLQHLMGLLMGGALYAVLVRLGVRPWLAALGAAPVLLDGFEVSIEEFLLSDTLFEFALVAACACLLWRRRPSVPLAAAAGAAVAVAAVTRSVGTTAFLPALLAAILLVPRRPWPAIALTLAFAIPLAGYATWYRAEHGSFAVSGFGGPIPLRTGRPVRRLPHAPLSARRARPVSPPA